MLLNINHDSWFWLVVTILSVWRITTLICYEKGPFDSMTKLRIFFYKIKLGSLIDCFHCTSMWLSILFCLLIYQLSFSILFLIFATAGGASIIENIQLNHHTHDQSNEDN